MADDNTQADGYYGEEELNGEELDLSFLDEDTDEKEDKASGDGKSDKK